MRCEFRTSGPILTSSGDEQASGGGVRMMAGAVLRAHRVIHDAGLHTTGPGGTDRIERASSASNEVWFAGPYVVRISTWPGSDRLGHEAVVASTLPGDVPYPAIEAHGRTEALEWVIHRRIPHSEPLSRAWPRLSEPERREAIIQLGAAMRALHRSPGPRHEDGTPWMAPFLEPARLECPHPLPVDHLLRLLDRAASLPGGDWPLMQHALAIVRSAASAFEDDPPVPAGLVHGDLHLENVLWDGEQVWLLDLEFARAAAPDLDLDVLLRFCADPTPHTAADYHLDRRDLRKVPVWLHLAYPDLFSHPRLADRLRVYSIAYDVRLLLLSGQSKPGEELHPDHPLHRIRRTVDGRNHLEWLEW